jgi:threonine/homoserine/homoserine lactone efflux protein
MPLPATLGYLAHGVALGVAIVLPVGPMKVLCLRRVIAYGPGAGGVTAIGVVSGDAVFVAIAALGLTAVAAALQSIAPLLRLLGGLALLLLAYRALRRAPPGGDIRLGRARLLSMYAGTVGLTLSNPTTIVMFTTVLLSAGGLEAIAGAGGGLIAIGIVLGSSLVWTAFTTVAVVAGRRLAPTHLLWLNRIAGALLALFGLLAVRAGLLALLPG